jgi:hypothetical protein
VNRAERRRAAREAARPAPVPYHLFTPEQRKATMRNAALWDIARMAGASPDEWVIFTSPGCDDERHVEEVHGAMWALNVRGPWDGVEVMDCGCTLELRPAP